MAILNLGLATIATADSITAAGNVIRFVNDQASPGASRFYGTDGTGTRGWFTFSSAGTTSLTGTAGQVLVNGTSGSAQTGAATLTLATALASIDSITASSATSLTLNGGSSGASVTVGQGTNGTVTLTAAGSGNVVLASTSGIATTSLRLTITNSTASASTTTGALVVTGGVGVGGSVYCGANFVVPDGAGFVFGSGITTYIQGNGTAQTINLVTNGVIRSQISNNSITVTQSTASSSSSTGALIVTGGVGIGGALNVGSTASVGGAGNTASTTSLIAKGYAINSSGDYGFILLNSSSAFTAAARQFVLTNALTGNSFAIIRSTDATTTPTLNTSGAVSSGTTDFSISNAGVVGVLGSTASTSTTTGALVVTGGVGIGGALNIGGNIGIATNSSADIAIYSTRTLSTSATNQYGMYLFVNSSATATAYDGIITRVGTADGTTIVGAQGIRIFVPTLGAGATIATLTGLSVNNQGATGVTNAIGIDISAQSGASSTNIGLRNAGTTSLTNATASTSTTTGALVVTGGAGIGGALYAGSTIVFSPGGTAPVLSTNGQVTFELTSNTTLSFKARGSDGTTRTGTVTLS